MAAQKGLGMRVVRPYGACDEGALCPYVVQVALATDCMAAPLKGSDDCRLHCGCLAGESQDVDVGQIWRRPSGVQV